jgi:hypothetical protein
MSELTVGQLRGLPVNNNIVTVPAGHTLYAPGSVLQVVQGTTTTGVNSSTTSYVDTGLSATITPKSTSSRVFVLVTQHIYKSAGSSENAPNLRIVRNSTVLGGGGVYIRTVTNMELNTTETLQILDSPNTTSPVTYKTTFANNTAASLVQVQPYGAPSTITLMEIAS